MKDDRVDAGLAGPSLAHNEEPGPSLVHLGDSELPICCVMKRQRDGEDAEAGKNSHLQDAQTRNGAKETFITERDVGIECYAHDVQRFHGILKLRYSDFGVVEIDSKGDVVQLKGEAVPEDVQVEMGDTAEVQACLGQEMADALREIVSNRKGKITTKVIGSKEERTHIHQSLRRLHPHLDSVTLPDDCIDITYTKRPSRRQGGQYLHLSMYKENKDTMEVVSLLARLLKISTKQIGFAGTKDRRGVTCQRISVRGLAQQRALGLNKSLRGVRLGNPTYADNELKLGDLMGNEFSITVREVDESFETVDGAIRSLRDHGFVNYFGMQRFGTSEVPTHTVGKLVLANKYREAVDALLLPCGGQLPESDAARQGWQESRDVTLTLQKMPRKCVAEVAVLTSLQTAKEDYSRAFAAIPRNLKLIYIHAYQSYVWNKAASARMTLGLTPIEGDLVASAIEEGVARARPISAIEVDRYNIYDILLPTPGHDILYPQSLKQVYMDVMAEDGLDPEQMTRAEREMSLTGSYRNLLFRPQHVSYTTFEYTERDELLNATPLQQLKPKENLHADGTSSFKGVRVQMRLGTAQYATMAMREIMECK